MGGAVGALVSKAIKPADPEMGYAMNTVGRAASSFVYDITYDLFSAGTVRPQNFAYYAVDVTMDCCFASVTYYYTQEIANSYINAAVNGVVDGFIDVTQTVGLPSPSASGGGGGGAIGMPRCVILSM